MIVSITGHRPDKLGGYYTPNPIYDSVIEGFVSAFTVLKPDLVISGMALGADQWAAEVCIAAGIPFLAAIPFEGQETVWPESSQKKYHKILNAAAKRYVISQGSYTQQKMKIRNEWMVDNSDILLAVFDGTTGGTYSCVSYAKKQAKPIRYLQYKNAAYDFDGAAKNVSDVSAKKSCEGVNKAFGLATNAKTGNFLKSLKPKSLELAKDELEKAKNKQDTLTMLSLEVDKLEKEKKESQKAYKKLAQKQKQLEVMTLNKKGFLGIKDVEEADDASPTALAVSGIAGTKRKIDLD